MGIFALAFTRCTARPWTILGDMHELRSMYGLGYSPWMAAMCSVPNARLLSKSHVK